MYVFSDTRRCAGGLAGVWPHGGHGDCARAGYGAHRRADLLRRSAARGSEASLRQSSVDRHGRALPLHSGSHGATEGTERQLWATDNPVSGNCGTYRYACEGEGGMGGKGVIL